MNEFRQPVKSTIMLAVFLVKYIYMMSDSWGQSLK